MSGWGPWSEGLADGEGRARMRVMRAISLVMLGRGSQLTRDISRALADPDALFDCCQTMDALPTLTFRRLVSAYYAAEMGAIDG